MDWKRNPMKVKSDLNKIVELSKKYDEINHELVLFCHKFDEITDNIKEFKTSLIDFVETFGISVLFTSIKDSGNFDIYIGYQIMLKKFSPLFTFINDFLNPLMGKYDESGHLLFLLDSDFTLVSDFIYSSENFDMVNVQQFKSTIIKMMKIINLDENKSSDFITFTYESSTKIVVCLRISNFNPDFSYVIMQADSYLLVDEIYREYYKMKERFSWIIPNN
ncbi:MAG: hypothetical protein ACTSQ5_07550 [Promethearchaeota archaeon]